MLVAAMNPCPCGYFGCENHVCTCSATKRRRYINRISGPMLDRIDLQVKLEDVKWEDLTGEEKSEPSAEILKRVIAARNLQAKRFAGTDIKTNSGIPPKYMAKFCRLQPKVKRCLKDF